MFSFVVFCCFFFGFWTTLQAKQLYQEPTFEVFVVCHTIKKTIRLTVQASNTVDNVRGQIQARAETAPKEQLITFGGKKLEDGKTLEDYNIKEESTLHMVSLLNMFSFVLARIEQLNYV